MTVAGHTVSHYEILDRLGGGGMGVVYTARDIKLGRLVALKFLPPELSRDEATNERFMLEAKAASALDHSNICVIHEIGETDDGQLFIAMQLYDGVTLKRRLQDGALGEDEAISITRQIAEGLAAAHKKGIIHRDVKPANIILTDDGRAVILDFGLAKLPGVLSLTKTGSTLGTAAYMAPEQLRGEKIDGRADLWSLGVVLYEMLTGRRPFEADYEQALAYAILNEQVPRPDDVESDLATAVLKLLVKDPAERYPDAEALIEAIDAVGERRRLADRREAGTEKEPASRRFRFIASGMAAVVVMVVVILIMRSGPMTLPDARDPNKIAVMPFSVRGDPELEYLGVGIVDLLSMRLDAVAEFGTVDPNGLLGLVAKDGLEITGPPAAVALANRLGAGKAIMGTVIRTGDAIQIMASLYDEDEEPIIEATATSPDEEHISTALDAVAQEIVLQLSESPDDVGPPLASMTSSSFPAVKSYLNGMHTIRLGQYDQAVTYLEDAVERDSTFALAWAMLSVANGWSAQPDREATALSNAFRLRGTLPGRAQALVEAAYYGFVVGDAEKSTELYRTVLASHPHDLYALFFMADHSFHYSPFLGKSRTEAREYFERANQLGPENAGVLQHLGVIAVDEGRYAEADSLRGLVFALSGEEGAADFEANAAALTRRTVGDSSWVFEDPGEMTAYGMRQLWVLAATGYHDTEAAAQIASIGAEGESYPKFVRSEARFMLGYAAAAEGRFEDQADTWARAGPGYFGTGILERAIEMALPVYPVSDAAITSLRKEVSDWDTLASPVNRYGKGVHDREHWAVKAYLDAILAGRLADSAGFARGKRILAERSDSTSGRNLPFALLKSLEAIEAWKAGKFERALDALNEGRLRILWRKAFSSILFEQVLDRFIKAEVLFELGEFETALEHYRSLTATDHWRGLIFLGPSYLRQAEIYERLGDQAKAIEYYARLVRLWKNSDPELIPMREEARRNLDRLLVESTREPAS